MKSKAANKVQITFGVRDFWFNSEMHIASAGAALNCANQVDHKIQINSGRMESVSRTAEVQRPSEEQRKKATKERTKMLNTDKW